MNRWTRYIQRYRNGEWRAPIFRDMILDEAKEIGDELTFLDIGCGKGFDDDVKLQESIAKTAGIYIGVEPDAGIPVQPYFDKIYRCFFEDASLEPGSIDLAYSVMVLEHLASPKIFWDKLYECLVSGGIFWGFTMDARHFFCKISLLMEGLRIKDLYLRMMNRASKNEKYENYPTYYRANSPSQITLCTRERFRSCQFIYFSRVGQLNYYLPKVLHPVANFIDRLSINTLKSGYILAVRVQK